MKKHELFIKFSATSEFSDVDYYLKLIVRRAVNETLKFEKFPFDAEVSVTFCDNKHIRELNRSFRDKDSHTDVLSFPMYDSGNFDISECISGAVLGDIVISVERAKEQAKEIGHAFFEEVAFLAVHSTLHLLGYDHERSKQDDELQCEKQRKIMELIEF